MVSVIWRKRALPIYWLLLNKKGSSNFQEQVAVIKPVIRLLKGYKLVVIGDREFRSTALASWLNNQKILFILRLNKNTLIKPKYQKYQSLNTLPTKPGDRVIYRQALVTQENQKERFNLVIYWKRKYNNKQLPDPWYLITNLENPEEVIKIFGSRGGGKGGNILKDNLLKPRDNLKSPLPGEAMFRDCKSGGYNLEGTKANEQRLTNLILLIALAYTSSCLVGLNIRKSGHQKYINRLNIERKNRPRHSYFWTGLYGTTWVLSIDICWGWVEKLMQISRNKLPFYLQGLRAMKHIQCLL